MAFGRERNTDISGTWKNPSQIIQEELARDEKLIWADVPISIKAHAYSAIPIALFGIPFFSFAVFWTWGASSMLRSGSGSGIDGFDIFFPMFGIPFLLVGLGMVLSPLWKMYKAKHLTYGMTDKRLIIRHAFPRIELQSWPLSSIKKLNRIGTAKGPGDIIFAEVEKSSNNGSRSIEKIGFIGISEPKRLEDKIRNLMK